MIYMFGVVIALINFLISMDAGIPCIIGNTHLLDNDEKLKKMLVLDSDDDVNEICEKIDNVLENKENLNNNLLLFCHFINNTTYQCAEHTARESHKTSKAKQIADQSRCKGCAPVRIS